MNIIGNPKISLIVSIYNGEAYIDRCMNSIYAQTFSDYEIILVNDGSIDNSLSLCRKYESKDKRITVVDKENGGLGSARNAGMAVARGEYITFPDVDDWMEPEMCAEMYALAQKGNYDIVIAGANNYSQQLKLINSVHYECVDYHTNQDCFDNIMFFFPTTLLFDVVWNKLYRREFLADNGLKFSDLRRAQDAYFNLEVFDHVESVITINKAFYNYLNNDAEKVNQKFPINYIDFNIAYFYKLKNVFKRRGLYCGDIKKQYDTSFVETIFATINMFDNPRWGLNKEGQIKYILGILNRKELTEYLETPHIREDAMWQYEIIREKDINKILNLHKKERFKDTLRNNKVLMSLYRAIRNR